MDGPTYFSRIINSFVTGLNNIIPRSSFDSASTSLDFVVNAVVLQDNSNQKFELLTSAVR